MFGNNSSIFFGALRCYFKAGAGAAAHQCRFDSSARKKKPDPPLLKYNKNASFAV
jgi:hypothetical protein